MDPYTRTSTPARTAPWAPCRLAGAACPCCRPWATATAVST